MTRAATPLEFADCTALVVDDAPMNRDLIAVMLTAMGVGRVDTAEDGLDALDRARRTRPDIVVLDIMMPRMDGFEFLARFRADPEFADIPVLVATALHGAEDRVRAFDSGASDYVVKPIDRRELIARAGVHLRNRQLVRRLTTYRDRLQQDLEVATAMQAALLPSQDQMNHLQRRYGVDMTAVIHASTEVSGDLWGWFPVDFDRFAVWLADFSGHGVAAAINTFRLHVILEGGPSGDPAAMLTRLNSTLVSVLPRGQFATMLYAVCDIRNQTLTFSSAGATAPVVCLPDGTAQLHPASSLPLGIRDGTPYGNVTLPFCKGCSLFLYSDGLSEAMGRDGVALGEEGARGLAREVATTHDLQNGIASLVQGGVTFTDDLSAVWVST